MKLQARTKVRLCQPLTHQTEKKQKKERRKEKKNVVERKAKRALYAKTTKVVKNKIKQKRTSDSENDMPQSNESSQYDTMKEEPDN